MRSTAISTTFRAHVGVALRSRRLQRGLSQEELAFRVDVTQGSISNYELGRCDVPLTVLLRVCDALEIRPVDLLPALGAESPLGDADRWERANSHR